MHIPLVHVSVAHLWQYIYPPYCNKTSEEVIGENMKQMEIHGHPPATGPRSTFLYDETAVLFTSLQCCVVWESLTVWWMWHSSVDTILFSDAAAHFNGSASITVKQFWSSSDQCVLCHFSIMELKNTVMNCWVPYKVVAFLTSWETIIGYGKEWVMIWKRQPWSTSRHYPNLSWPRPPKTLRMVVTWLRCEPLSVYYRSWNTTAASTCSVLNINV